MTPLRAPVASIASLCTPHALCAQTVTATGKPAWQARDLHQPVRNIDTVRMVRAYSPRASHVLRAPDASIASLCTPHALCAQTVTTTGKPSWQARDLHQPVRHIDTVRMVRAYSP